jgi:hypothetical protein
MNECAGPFRCESAVDVTVGRGRDSMMATSRDSNETPSMIARTSGVSRRAATPQSRSCGRKLLSGTLELESDQSVNFLSE